MELIQKYFPSLDAGKMRQFRQLESLYSYWNERINVISRKDIAHLYERHVLHSLAIAKIIRFSPGTTVIDLGTGGGFPGIPLSILFPEVRFLLIDGTGKKVGIANSVAESLGLGNAAGYHCRAEDFKEKGDFVVSRAVARLDLLWKWSQKLILPKSNNPLPNGLLAFKGGDFKEEFRILEKGLYKETFRISDIFEEPYFEEKFLVYLQF